MPNCRITSPPDEEKTPKGHKLVSALMNMLEKEGGMFEYIKKDATYRPDMLGVIMNHKKSGW